MHNPSHEIDSGSFTSQFKHYRISKKFQIPSNAWDSHMHILEPNRFPLDTAAVYKPSTYRVSQNLRFEAALGLEKVLIVQPSIYGDDNSCVLSALQEYGHDHARAIVTFNPDRITGTQLEEWHELGVRGIRVNLSSARTQYQAEELGWLLERYADIIRPFGWVLQLYMPLKYLEELEDIIVHLDVKVVLDHFGHPDLTNALLTHGDSTGPNLDAIETDVNSVEATSSRLINHRAPPVNHKVLVEKSVPGLSALRRLLKIMNRPGEVAKLYIKLSAPYRLSTQQKATMNQLRPTWLIDPTLKAYAMDLLRQNRRSRCLVFATDWPHTRFEGLDIEPFVETVQQWCYEVASEKRDDTEQCPEETVVIKTQEMIDDLFRYAAEEMLDVQS